MTTGTNAVTALAQPAGQWLTQRAQYATRELGDCVEWNANKLGGAPVLKGTRISVAQVLAELGEGQSAEEVAADFDLDVVLVRTRPRARRLLGSTGVVMTAFQLDQCLDSKRFARDCAAQALCHTARLPPSLRNADDPELLRALMVRRVRWSRSTVPSHTTTRHRSPHSIRGLS